MKIISLVGARPQFIKEAILAKEFKKRNIKEILVHSGQHYDINMSSAFFKELNIKKPDYYLKVGSGNHAEMTGKIMIAFENIVLKEKPNFIIVYGDTNTTLAGAITGAKLKIPIAHIEAGIRMKPKDMPEEINRVLVDRISSFLFCPSDQAIKNLKKEGIIGKNVINTGDIMYDLYLTMEKIFKYDIYHDFQLNKNKFVVVTLHRDYNVDNKKILKNILIQLQKINKEIKIIFPIHPRTKKRINEFKLLNYLKKIKTIEPLDYLNLMGLIKKSYKVITDSGGLQKETYFAHKHSVVLMPDTGWRELITNKWNILANENNLYNKVFSKNWKSKYIPNIYGVGNAGQKIVNILQRNYSS